MEQIGENIERLDQILRAATTPHPRRRWQTEAEHVVNVAHFASKENNLAKLRELDLEAERLIRER